MNKISLKKRFAALALTLSLASSLQAANGYYGHNMVEKRISVSAEQYNIMLDTTAYVIADVLLTLAKNQVPREVAQFLKRCNQAFWSMDNTERPENWYKRDKDTKVRCARVDDQGFIAVEKGEENIVNRTPDAQEPTNFAKPAAIEDITTALGKHNRKNGLSFEGHIWSLSYQIARTFLPQFLYSFYTPEADTFNKKMLSNWAHEATNYALGAGLNWRTRVAGITQEAIERASAKSGSMRINKDYFDDSRWDKTFFFGGLGLVGLAESFNHKGFEEIINTIFEKNFRALFPTIYKNMNVDEGAAVLFAKLLSVAATTSAFHALGLNEDKSSPYYKALVNATSTYVIVDKGASFIKGYVIKPAFTKVQSLVSNLNPYNATSDEDEA